MHRGLGDPTQGTGDGIAPGITAHPCYDPVMEADVEPVHRGGLRWELMKAVRRRLEADEADLPPPGPPSTLFDHSLRVAALAERIAGSTPGVPPGIAYVAGLLHDVGKFCGGRYHVDDVPEEVHSAEAARELMSSLGFPTEQVEAVEGAILDLHRDDLEPGSLTQVVCDADSLDKLGPAGVASFFVKAGLRGRGLGLGVLSRLSIELTYARCAPRVMWTGAGRDLAAERAPRSEAFFLELIEVLRADGFCDLVVETVELDSIELVVVRPQCCGCGGELMRTVCEEKGLKCTEIHVTHGCRDCGDERSFRMCRPRLVRG
jgi:putative nucleotidyltransferase with HDIG domain